MVYLKPGKVEDCRRQLETLNVRGDAFYGKKAGELLKEIGR
jgi:hypothetical protein